MQAIKIRLGSMMFLQFFIWGAWFVTLGTFLSQTLKADGPQIGAAFASQSWGAIIAPFFVGLIADRFFNAERILGILHLIGAVLMYLMAQAADFSTFYPLVLGYMLAYMPTLALVNSVAFAQLQQPEREFGQIRVWGTIGWVVAGLVISYGFAWDATTAIAEGALQNTFMLGAIASALLGFYSFSLPATPPASRGQAIKLGRVAWLRCTEVIKR